MKTTRKIISIVLCLMLVLSCITMSMLSVSATENLTTTIDTGEEVTLEDTDGDGYYEIWGADDLYAFAALVNSGYTDLNAILVYNIELNYEVIDEYSTDARHWTPIGNYDNKYNGTFDGNNKIISGLYFDDSMDYVGLFGAVDYDGTVKSVTLENSYIKGIYYVGFVGENSGLIENCLNKSVIKGSNCVGGIVGDNYGSVMNSCNIGTIDGIARDTGAIAGCDQRGVDNCYYLDTSYPYDNGDNTEPKTVDEFASGEVAYALGDGWGQLLGYDAFPVLGGEKVNYGYKHLATEKIYTNDEDVYDYITDHQYENGFCTYCDEYEPAVDSDNDTYYEIDNPGKLYWFAQQVNGGNSDINAILTADITVNEEIIDENSTNIRYWHPISDYNGTFDGNGKTISGLYYKNDISIRNYIGLFGNVRKNGLVKNTTIKNSCFIGELCIGSIAGTNNGTIENCSSTAKIIGISKIGGIVGENCGKVHNCSNTGEIIGDDECVGGVAGYCNNAIVENCYNLANVNGKIFVGGVVGLSNSIGTTTIKNCFNIGKVTSFYNNAGGVVGKRNGIITNCYYLDSAWEGEFIEGEAEPRTAEQFASGEVAYLLGDAFGQKIGTDLYPVLGGDKVYCIVKDAYTKEKIYSNTPLECDVDLDGLLTIKDATMISKHLVGREELNDVQLSLADANNDGTININDVTQIQKILVRA